MIRRARSRFYMLCGFFRPPPHTFDVSLSGGGAASLLRESYLRLTTTTRAAKSQREEDGLGDFGLESSPDSLEHPVR